MIPAQKPQRRPALSAKPLQKPALGPEMIQSAMDRRPRLNANARRVAAPGAAPPPVAPVGPPKPAWQQLRDAGMGGQGNAVANRAAVAGLPAAAAQQLPVSSQGSGIVGAEIQSDPGHWTPERIAQAKPMPFGGQEGQFGEPGNVNGGPLMGGGMSEMPLAADPNAMPGFTPHSGSQNPLFSANLPPQIMQRLQALQAGRGGAGVVGAGQGAPGARPPGAPAAGPALPDYYSVDPYGAMLGGIQPPPQGAGAFSRPMRPGFDRRMAY